MVALADSEDIGESVRMTFQKTLVFSFCPSLQVCIWKDKMPTVRVKTSTLPKVMSTLQLSEQTNIFILLFYYYRTEGKMVNVPKLLKVLIHTSDEHTLCSYSLDPWYLPQWTSKEEMKVRKSAKPWCIRRGMQSSEKRIEGDTYFSSIFL